MLQKLFTSLYQALLSTAAPASLIPVYQKSIFPGVGLGTFFGVSLLAAALFYLLLNRFLTTSFYKTGHWFVIMFLAAIGSAILAWTQARAVVFASLEGETLGTIEQSAYDRYVLGFLVVNALYGALFFVFWSFVIKPLSVSARTTPVRWPN